MICGSHVRSALKLSLGTLLEVELWKKCTPLWREAHFEVKSVKNSRSRTTFGSWAVVKVQPLWHEAHFEIKMYKTHHGRTTFGSWDVEKVHAVVARSTFPSHNVQNTRSDHLKPLLEVETSKKCTHEAHFQVKMYKTHQCWTTIGSWDVEKVHAVVARSTLPSQNVQNTRGSGPLFDVPMSKKWTLTNTFNYTTLQLQLQLQPHYNYNYTTPHPTTLHYTALHYTTLRYTPLHYTTLHCTALHYTTLHYTTVYYTTLHYTTLHYTTLRYITLHYTTLHFNPLHYITLHYTTHHYTTQHSTTLHYIALQ